MSYRFKNFCNFAAIEYSWFTNFIVKDLSHVGSDFKQDINII